MVKIYIHLILNETISEIVLYVYVWVLRSSYYINKFVL